MTETEKLHAVHDLRRQVNAESDAARDHSAAAFALEAEIARLQGDDLSARWYDALAATYRARFSPETWAEYERLAAERNGTKTETDAAGAAQ